MRQRTRQAGAARLACMMGLAIGLTACQAQERSREEQTDAPVAGAREDDAVVAPEPEKKSIIREDIEPTPTTVPVLEPETLTIPFSATGELPDEGGLKALDEVMAHPVFKLGGPITIWGHSDSRGSDSQNLVASRRRAEKIRDYLKERGVPGGRITVIPLGEARPIAPNRKLDGSDDKDGRARNRRVDIKVDLPPVPPKADPGTTTGSNPSR